MPQPINSVSNRALNPNISSTGNVNWVPGLNGAKNWKMYPGTIDILMDNVNQDIYYIKVCDETGAFKPLRAFQYHEIPLEEVPLQDVDMPSASNFVTKDDFAAFKNEILEAIKSNSGSNNGYHKNNRKPNYNGGNQNNDRS